MTTLQFTNTYNLVAFLAKPAESEGFEQIVDFLNAHTIKYALTVNSTIYTSCIEQFWATFKVKTVNEEVQLQALVDGKKIIVTEASIRRDLQLNDEEGTDCLPNVTIFEELKRMGAKTTAWNEFSSTMASTIICLATNQKFNFSKYIFEIMVKNLDNAGKFLMYPRKRFFRKGNTFVSNNGVQNQAEMGEGSAIPTDPHHTPTIIQPSTSQPQKKQRSRRPKRKDTKVPQPSGPTTNVADEAVYEERDDSLERAATTATGLYVEHDRGVNTPRSDEDRLKLNELMEFCTKLQQRVLDLENTKTAQAQEITSLKLRVKKLEKKGGSRTHKLKRLYKVGQSARVISFDEAKITLVHETQGRYGDEEMFDTDVLDGDEVLAEPEVTVKDVNLSVDEVTLAQALAALKRAKVLKKANVVEEPSESIKTTPTLTTTTAATTITAVSTRPRAKGLIIYKEEQATTPTVSS
ncbi:hypothetical protein Tco_0587819 [Tanacetum coccineum]